jgi:hypothetical protein
MTKYFNPKRPDGVPIDGSNDEVFGNLDDPCNDNYDSNDTGQLDQGYRSLYQTLGVCNVSPYHQSVDLSDPTLSDANAALAWNETSGPWGTIVDRYSTEAKDMTPGGTPQSLMAVPYYRDDSCFDDATGSDPGPRVDLNNDNEPRTTSTGAPRKCWHPSDGIPDGSDKYFQGDIGTHGLHLLFQLESDNARQTVPVDEIVSDQQMVFLPGDPGNVGEEYGRDFEKPLVASVSPVDGYGDDNTAPSAKVAVTRHGAAVALAWSGRDRGGSGLWSYTVQARDGSGSWRTIARNTRRRSMTFHAKRGHSYAFRVQAMDRAGNYGLSRVSR